MRCKIEVSAFSNTGNVRSNNEDNLYINTQFMKPGDKESFQLSDTIRTNSYICAVCDGMGGEKGGETASFEAVSRLHDAVKNTTFSKMDLQNKIQRVNKYVGETNRAIHDMAEESIDLSGMGTTFACLMIEDSQAVAMNVGDSRVYLHRKETLKQLTRDHSESERLIRLGIITREQARGHKSRFMLNRHLGMALEEGILEADTSEIIQLQEDDTFLICSDGLTDMVEDKTIEDILCNCVNADDASQKLMNEALVNGGKDNVSAIIVNINKFIKRSLMDVFREVTMGRGLPT